MVDFLHSQEFPLTTLSERDTPGPDATQCPFIPKPVITFDRTTLPFVAVTRPPLPAR